MTATARGIIWVCTDCMLARENDQEPTDHRPDEPEPWALEPNLDVTRMDDCQDFSESPCDGCGSWLGGERWDYAWWG